MSDVKPLERIKMMKNKLELNEVTPDDIHYYLDEMVDIIEHQCHAIEAMAIVMKNVGALVSGINRQLAMNKPRVIVPGDKNFKIKGNS